MADQVKATPTPGGGSNRVATTTEQRLTALEERVAKLEAKKAKKE